MTISPASRQLNLSNWNTGRNFTVYAIDDAISEAEITYTLGHTSTSNQTGSLFNSNGNPNQCVLDGSYTMTIRIPVDPRDTIPATPIRTPSITPTVTSSYTATTTATATLPPTLTATPTPILCSIFGCAVGSNPVDWGIGHLNTPNVIDLVPVGVTDGQPNYSLPDPQWPDRAQYVTLIDVYSPVGGNAQVIAPPDRTCTGCQDIRVRTSDGVCYQFKHIIPTITTGSVITASTATTLGTRLGSVIPARLDSTPFYGAGLQSHLHVDRYLCDVNFYQTSGTLPGAADIRTDIPYLLPYFSP